MRTAPSDTRRAEVTAQFGGDDGVVVTARLGDVIVLRAGRVGMGVAVSQTSPGACA
jgi:uncharacterized protein YjlB